MKIIKCLVCLIFFVAAFAEGCFIFAPRDEAGKLALAYVRLAASRQGYYVTYEGFSGSGIFNPSYRITGLDVEGPMTKITFSDLQATVYPLSSVMSGSARVRLQFGETGVLLIGNNSLSLKSGEMDISAAGNLVSVTDANMEGDVGISGDIAFDIGARAITESTATVKVTPLVNAMLGTQAAARFVEPISPGVWRIKKNAR
ncbi:MAG: hypothetical protein LBS35_03430 [Synergistaceae bacterium]|jgi:hypothetical protein|nr:hypothetical protein [Synergistaceae bacterium]